MYKYCNHCMSAIENGKNICTKCGHSIIENVPAHHLLPGTILNNKYYVGKALGEGGFGITYIGRDINLDIKVAIKEYYPNGYVNRNNTISPQVNNSVTAGRKEFFTKGREKFLNEARVLARFSGESGVVDVRDFFEANDTAYIVMEYLDGMDLKNYLKRNGKLTVEQTINLLMPVMNSLKKIHSQNLIHRDISPDNIMIVGNDVKLLDFGSARSVAAFENKSLSVMLKPGYAPEEQYRSKGQQGPWTDVYAICATIYKCITGITPDDATQRVFSDEVKKPSVLGVKISPEIEKVIMRGMSVYHKDRYQSIDDLIKALQGSNVAKKDEKKPVTKKDMNDNQGTVVLFENMNDERGTELLFENMNGTKGTELLFENMNEKPVFAKDFDISSSPYIKATGDNRNNVRLEKSGAFEPFAAQNDNNLPKLNFEGDNQRIAEITSNPYNYTPPVERPKRDRGKVPGLIAMILGFAGYPALFAYGLGFFLFIAAIILGSLGIKSSKSSGYRNGKALAGLLLGIFGIIASILAFVGFIFLVLAMDGAQTY